MKKIGIFILILVSFSINAQKLKTVNTAIEYEGFFMGNPTGKATYTCYEDEKMNDIRHGKFNFTYNADAKINDYISERQTRSFTITGNYKNGFKDGTWVFTLVDKNVFDGYRYYTGTLKLTANFKDGKPNGNWTFAEQWSSKTIQYYSLEASGYPAVNNTLSANFNMGVLNGNLSYSASKENNKIAISFDSKGYITSYVDETDKYKDVYIFENLLLKQTIYKNKASGKAETKDYSLDIIEYNSKPDYYTTTTKKMDFFPNYFWNKFNKDEFNFKNIDDNVPTFDGGYYQILNKRSEINTYGLLDRYINDDFSTIKEAILLYLDGNSSTLENKMQDYITTVENKIQDKDYITIDKISNQLFELENSLPNIIKIIKETDKNSFITPNFDIYTDFKEGNIAKFDSIYALISNTRITINKYIEIEIEKERLLKEKKEKEFNDLLVKNNEYSSDFKKNHDYISTTCLTLKTGSTTDLNAISPKRCISSEKRYNAVKNTYVYDCLMINKEHFYLWNAYSIIIQNNDYVKKLRQIEALEKKLQGHVYGGEKQELKEELDNLNKTNNEIATTDNGNLITIINLQKKIIEILSDKKNTKIFNKKLKDISDYETIKEIILK
jgi:hypothetical protein